MNTTIQHNQTGTKKKQPQTSKNSNHRNEEKEKRKSKKKIASYSLEVDLLHKVRKLAHQQDRYYSSIVTEALETLISHYQNGNGQQNGTH